MTKLNQSSFRRILLSRILLLSVPVLLIGEAIAFRKVRSSLLETSRMHINVNAIRKSEQISAQIATMQTKMLLASQTTALTHPSVSATANYEQLEFIGDAVVRLVAAEVLWDVYPDWKVGEFAAIRSVLVSDRILASLATHYAIEPYLLVTSSDKEGQQSRLADAFEAVLGALYLSTHNLELIRPWLDPHFIKLAKEIRSDPARLNYKAALQEWTQGHFKVLPEYRASENALGHRAETAEERFSAQVWLQDRQIGQGKGRSIKAAEQAAAQMAFMALSQQEE